MATLSKNENIAVSDVPILFIPADNQLYQIIYLESGMQYKISYVLTTSDNLTVALALHSFVIGAGTHNDSETFTNSASTGYYAITLTPAGGSSVTIDSIGVKKTTDDNPEIPTIKEFLTGDLDEDQEIFFRVDTQILQLQTNPEYYSLPVSVITETERGSMMQAFVNLNEKSFYPLEGTVTKGVSSLDISSYVTSPNEQNVTPVAQTLQLSYRDSSKQRCRLVQAAVVIDPTKVDVSE